MTIKRPEITVRECDDPRGYQRQYRALPDRKAATRAYDQTPERKAKKNAASTLAHWKAAQRKKNGGLPKPAKVKLCACAAPAVDDDSLCSWCGSLVASES